MKIKTHDLSYNPSDTTKIYDRTIYACEEDELWLTTEKPTKTPNGAKVIYKNWRGETAERHILPIRIWFGQTEWHPNDQWFLTALDLDKKVERDFALKDIEQWL